MRRARYITAAVVAGLALSIAACGGSDSSDDATQNAKATKKLEVFSWWTSGSEDAALKELFSTFKTADPGVTITNGAVAGGGGSNAQAVLQTRLQGNNAPDSWQTHPGLAIAQYVDAGYVADLSSVQKKLGDVMPKALVDAQSKDGKVYGVSTGAHRATCCGTARRSSRTPVLPSPRTATRSSSSPRTWRRSRPPVPRRCVSARRMHSPPRSCSRTRSSA
jgi:glucose/mannose transport system substrate-binding protein